jgi:outer membrane protein assembly factor BamD (BamD/ComL family)
MSAKKATKKELKEDGLVKNVFSLVAYIQEHSTVSMIIAGAIIVAVAAIWGFSYSNKKSNERAMEKLGIAQLSFRLGALAESKDTLTYIVNNYGRTNAGKLALYYLGYINYINGSYDLALEYYDKFLKSGIKDADLKAAATYGVAISYEGKGDHRKAADTYMELMSKYPEYFNNDEVMLNAARAYKACGDTSKAIALLEDFLKKYPTSMRKEEAKSTLLELTARK